MKAALVLISGVCLLASCAAEKDIQVKMATAQLVQIDTIKRYSYNQLYLTWRCSDNATYSSYAPLRSGYRVGEVIPIMIRR